MLSRRSVLKGSVIRLALLTLKESSDWAAATAAEQTKPEQA